MTAAEPSAGLRVRKVDAATDARWDRFVTSHPAGTGYLHSRWLEGLAAETPTTQHHLITEDDAGDVVGVLPLVETRGLPGGGQLSAARLASLPRSPMGGPLAWDTASAAALVQAAVDLADERGLRLQLKSVGGAADWSHLGVSPMPWRVGYVLALPADVDELRFGVARNDARIRTAVRCAERAGLRVRRAGREALATWYPLYLDTMRWHGVPARPRRFFEVLLAPAGPAVLNLVERAPSGQVVAGSIDLQCSVTTTYAFNGIDRSSFPLRPMDLLIVSSIRQAVADGSTRYDLGEVSSGNEGLRRFKAKWGASEVTISHHHRPLPPHVAGDEPLDGRLGAALRRTWRHVPLPITARAGEIICARL